MRRNPVTLCFVLCGVLISGCSNKSVPKPPDSPAPHAESMDVVAPQAPVFSNPGPAPPDEQAEDVPIALTLERNQVVGKSFSVSTSSPDEVVYFYVVARITRRTDIMLAVLTDEMAAKHGFTATGPTFGMSSPWVERAEVVKKQSLPGNRWRYQIRYTMATSQGSGLGAGETIQVAKFNNGYRISDLGRG